MAKRKTKETTSFIVTLRCVVITEVVCSDCTREQAEAHPFAYSISEEERELLDWEVQRVEEND